jgi:hypothetical protein
VRIDGVDHLDMKREPMVLKRYSPLYTGITAVALEDERPRRGGNVRSQELRHVLKALAHDQAHTQRVTCAS